MPRFPEWPQKAFEKEGVTTVVLEMRPSMILVLFLFSLRVGVFEVLYYLHIYNNKNIIWCVGGVSARIPQKCHGIFARLFLKQESLTV